MNLMANEWTPSSGSGRFAPAGSGRFPARDTRIVGSATSGRFTSSASGRFTTSTSGRQVPLRVVDISDMIVSTNREEVIVTYSLGSCVGVTLYDPVAGVGGMIHCMLPLSKINKERAQDTPCMFVDTGVMKLLQAVFDLGAERGRIIAKVAGAAKLLDKKEMFRIGERNYTVLRKILWKNDILISAEAIRGTIARTMYLYMADGRVTWKSKGVETDL